MPNKFMEKSTVKMPVTLSDGRIMPLEDLVREYERLLNEESSKKAVMSEPKENKPTVSKLKVGEWFRIDREVINKNKDRIRRKCVEAGRGDLWESFKEANRIAENHPDRYPRLIETFVFEHNWKYKTFQDMLDMCTNVGDGMCDCTICDLELQMRICNGEFVEDIVMKPDKLPRVRVIYFGGGMGCFGGGIDDNDNHPPAYFHFGFMDPYSVYFRYTPYAFRRVF